MILISIHDNTMIDTNRCIVLSDSKQNSHNKVSRSLDSSLSSSSKSLTATTQHILRQEHQMYTTVVGRILIMTLIAIFIRQVQLLSYHHHHASTTASSMTTMTTNISWNMDKRNTNDLLKISDKNDNDHHHVCFYQE